jgi:hypothetical protein
MSITVVLEFRARSGKRAEVLCVPQDLTEKYGSGLPANPGKHTAPGARHPDTGSVGL